MDTDFIISKDGTLKKYIGYETDVVIPEGVVKIGYHAFYYRKKVGIRNIVIPETVVSIGNGAFAGSRRLKSIIIPDHVESIGNEAFQDCSSLETIRLPETVKSIGYSCFQNCTALKTIVLPEGIASIPYASFHGCSSLEKISIKGVKEIGYKAFFGCSSLSTVLFAENVTSISQSLYYYTDGDFKGCTSLWDSNGMLILGHWLLEYRGDKESVTIPQGIRFIWGYAFAHIAGLKNIVIPEGVESIGERAFFNCADLECIAIPDTVSDIGSEAFADCRKIEYVKMPKNCSVLKSGTFYNCSSLERVELPDTVTELNYRTYGNNDIGVFQNCRNLKEIRLPKSLKNIGSNCFKDCKRLSSIEIPQNVTRIGERAFSMCENLSEVAIQGNETKLEQGVFEGCSSMKQISFGIKNNSKMINKYCFGIALPYGLRNQIRELYHYMDDTALREYISGDEWNGLDTELQAEIILNRYKKSLAAYFDGLVNSDNCCTIGINLARIFTEDVDAKYGKSVTAFLLRYGAGMPRDLLLRIQEMLKRTKAGAKVLKKIKEDPVLKEVLHDEDDTEESGNESVSSCARLAISSMKKNGVTATAMLDRLKESFGITYSDLPDLYDVEGRKLEPLVWAFLLNRRGILDYPGLSNHILKTYGRKSWDKLPLRSEIRLSAGEQKMLDEIDHSRFMEDLKEISVRFLDNKSACKKTNLLFPICVYADEQLMQFIVKWSVKHKMALSGKNHPFMAMRISALYSDTRAAMLYADRQGDLKAYAHLRGMGEEEFRNKYLSDVGLDMSGRKTYDLGNQMVTVRMLRDFSFIIEAPDTGKTMRVIPKKGAEPDKYEAARNNFAVLKSDVKNVIKNRSDILFQEFLSGKTCGAENWKETYLGNSVLKNMASLFVWSQGHDTFTVTDTGMSGSDGKTYELGEEKIRLAHPMEMGRKDLLAWQEYFLATGLKQPFAQVWEPVYDPETIHKERYRGCAIRYKYLMKRQKHGIDAAIYQTYDDLTDHISLKGCSIGHELSEDIRWDSLIDTEAILGDFYYKVYDRQVNHIVHILDKLTVFDRIRKDDETIREYIGSFTLAQILECIKTANESGSVNCQAILLEERNERWPEYNSLESLLLF